MARRDRKVQDFEFAGEIVKISGNNNYHVKLTDSSGNEKEILCYLSGNMRRFKINVLLGDRVKVIVPPPFDKGRIVFREK